MPIALAPRPLAPVPDIVDVTTRREILIGAGAGLLLTACGASDRPSTRAASAQTRAFDHFFGTTEIPVEPKRIVSTENGVLASLDVQPVGAPLQVLTSLEYLEPQLEDVQDIGSTVEPNLEAVAALQPDLILTFGRDGNEERYETLAQIAPTVAPAFGFMTLEQTKAHWLGVGDGVGQRNRGDEVVAEFDGRIADLGARFAGPMADKPVSVLRVGTEGFYSVRFGSLESSLLKAVGVPRPVNQQDPEGFAFDLRMERVEEVDAWAIFVYVDQGADDKRTALEANPLWGRLQAVQVGRVFTVDAGVWNGLDPIAADLVLDDIDRHLTGALAAAS